MAGYELSNIVKPSGDHMPGMSEELLICLRSEVLQYPTESTYTDPGDTMKLTGDITFTPPAGFVSVYVTEDTAKLMLSRIGQPDSRGWKVDFEFWCPGLNPAFAEMLHQEHSIIALVRQPDCSDQTRIMLGAACKGLKMSADYDSDLSSNDEGRNGWTGKITGRVAKWHIYAGEVTMKGAGGE